MPSYCSHKKKMLQKTIESLSLSLCSLCALSSIFPIISGFKCDFVCSFGISNRITFSVALTRSVCSENAFLVIKTRLSANAASNVCHPFTGASIVSHIFNNNQTNTTDSTLTLPNPNRMAYAARLLIRSHDSTMR